MITAILVTIILIMATAFFYVHRRREKKLEQLTAYLMQVQNDLSLPKLEESSEGQIGILQSEIYKLVVLLKQRSDSANRQREYLAKMLSDISHQIKTPLTSITLMTDLLKSPELSEDKRMEFAERIDQSVNRITWLVKNLLVLSQLEADMLKLKKERVSARKLVEQAYHSLELMAEVKGIALNIRVDEKISMVCDLRWTAEALSNIVKNCLEHTPSGGQVCISCEQNNFSTNICIEDNGEGIAKEQLSHIFERFYKADNASPNSVGIGLSMAKQIILQQNGVINVESEPGKGTSFLIKMYLDNYETDDDGH